MERYSSILEKIEIAQDDHSDKLPFTIHPKFHHICMSVVEYLKSGGYKYETTTKDGTVNEVYTFGKEKFLSDLKKSYGIDESDLRQYESNSLEELYKVRINFHRNAVKVVRK